MSKLESVKVNANTRTRADGVNLRRRSLFKAIVVVVLFNVSLFVVVAQPRGLRLVPSVGNTTQISQHGITWYFDGPVEFGRFVNGDYWVLGPVTITGIDPPTRRNEAGRIIDGSMINPRAGVGRQGFDNTRSYDSALNVEWGLSTAPLSLSPGTTLVSAISDPARTRPYLRTAAILTVLRSAPARDAFRPGYSDPSKRLFRAADLDTQLLLSLNAVSSAPTLATVERMFERPWLDWIPDWDGRDLHPRDNMPDYGREIARNVGVGALMLHLDFPLAEKETLLYRYVQLGIDLYSIVANGGHQTWLPNGGHASGRKWPILFAGIMLGDEGMMAVGQRSGQYLYSGGNQPGSPPSDYIFFGEDAQTFYIGDKYPEMVGMTLNPDNRDSEVHEYQESDRGFPEWGIRYATHPNRSNKFFGTVYRTVTAVTWDGFTLAARLMGAEALWNHPPLFDYVERYITIVSGGAYTPPGEASPWVVPGEGQIENQPGSDFARDMWWAYWHN